MHNTHVFALSKFHDAVYVHLDLDGITMWPSIVGIPEISVLQPTITGWNSTAFMEPYTFCTPAESEVKLLAVVQFI